MTASDIIDTAREAMPAKEVIPPRVHRKPIHAVGDQTKRRIRLTARGWDAFTGDFGQIKFENGISVEKVTSIYYDRVAGQIRAVDDETGEQLGPRLRRPDHTAPAPVIEHLRIATPEQIAALKIPDTIETAPQGPEFFTRKQLETMVDKGGINALREIAAPLGVKARAIPDLISAILSTQATIEAKRKGND